VHTHSQMNTVYNLSLYLFKIHFNIILPFTSPYYKYSLSLVSHICSRKIHMIRPSHSSNNVWCRTQIEKLRFMHFPPAFPCFLSVPNTLLTTLSKCKNCSFAKCQELDYTRVACGRLLRTWLRKSRGATFQL